MNSADFYLFYLHLANQKAIKNYYNINNNYQKNYQNFTYQPDLRYKTLHFMQSCERTEGFLYRRERISSLSFADCGVGRVEHRFVKETFALLAFAGLQKTIAVAEWRNLFGHRGHLTTNRTGNNNYKIFSNIFSKVYYNHSHSVQKTCKLKALNRFKKLVNPAVTNFRRDFSLAYKTKLRETAKASSKRCLNLFNQRILSQSFKNNFIHNLQNCEKQATHMSGFSENLLSVQCELRKSFLENYLSYQGQNKLPLTLNKATTNYFEPAHLTLNQNLHSQTFLTFARLFLSQNSSVSAAHIGQRADLAGSGEMLGRSKSREDHQMSLVSWAPILDLRGPHSINIEIKSLDEKSALYRSQTAPNFSDITIRSGQIQSYGVPKKSAHYRLRADCGFPPTGPPKKDFVGTARVSYIKDSFDSTKKEILLASPTLIKFYTASWLLESIRTELSSRNANIKRVLNQIFLLTQQPPQSANDREQIFGRRTVFGRSRRCCNIGQRADLSMGKIQQLTNQCELRDSTTLIKEASVIPYLIKGLRITFSGRLGGKKGMAKTLTKTTGRVPLSTLREKVDFAKGVVQTKAGSLGVKVWICHN